MRELHIASVAADGSHLVLVDDAGQSFALRIDERSYRAVRELVELTGKATSDDAPVTPRDIQARIRTGATVEEVAREAGMDPARVLAYARPVLAERAHVAERAGASPLGEATLAEVVADRLTAGGGQPELAEWDAHLDADGGWVVTVTYRLEDEVRRAAWRYAPSSHVVAPMDGGARWFDPADSSPEAAEAAPATASRGGRGSRGRASVPRWDDILLGERRPDASGTDRP